MNIILMTEEVWANSQFSIARYYGAINISGHRFVIVNKHGQDIFECSRIAEKEGRAKAIEPGEPADLVREDFIPIYKKHGRDKFIGALKAHPEVWMPKQLEKVLENYHVNK